MLLFLFFIYEIFVDCSTKKVHGYVCEETPLDLYLHGPSVDGSSVLVGVDLSRACSYQQCCSGGAGEELIGIIDTQGLVFHKPHYYQ